MKKISKKFEFLHINLLYYNKKYILIFKENEKNKFN
jgi:hypothetical protein